MELGGFEPPTSWVRSPICGESGTSGEKCLKSAHAVGVRSITLFGSMPGVTGEATDHNWSVEHVAGISLGLDLGNIAGVRGGPSVRQSRARNRSGSREEGRKTGPPAWFCAQPLPAGTRENERSEFSRGKRGGPPSFHTTGLTLPLENKLGNPLTPVKK